MTDAEITHFFAFVAGTTPSAVFERMPTLAERYMTTKESGGRDKVVVVEAGLFGPLLNTLKSDHPAAKVCQDEARAFMQ